jgi:hypothetical protein
MEEAGGRAGGEKQRIFCVVWVLTTARLHATQLKTCPNKNLETTFWGIDCKIWNINHQCNP